jgi:hypothetical protein
MAKITIIIEDLDDGSANVRVDWDPPMDEDADEDEFTTAQNAAVICLDSLEATCSEFEEVEEN